MTREERIEQIEDRLYWSDWRREDVAWLLSELKSRDALLAEAREALRVFGEHGAFYTGVGDHVKVSNGAVPVLTLGHCCRAAAVAKKLEG